MTEKSVVESVMLTARTAATQQPPIVRSKSWGLDAVADRQAWFGAALERCGCDLGNPGGTA